MITICSNEDDQNSKKTDEHHVTCVSFFFVFFFKIEQICIIIMIEKSRKIELLGYVIVP